MNAEKIYIRESGNKVKITASVSVGYVGGQVNWVTDVETCEKGKRSWFCVVDSDNHLFRKLSLKDRHAFILETQLKHVTEAEILEVKMMVWQQLKPV